MSLRGMKTILTVLAIWVLTTVPAVKVSAETVTTTHRIESMFPTSSGIDLNSDGQMDLSFQGSGLTCTLDVPTSGCTASIAIQGTASIEFLLTSSTGSNIPTPLASETLLGPGTPDGFWATAQYNNTVRIGVSRDMRLGITAYVPEPLPDDEFNRVGFRFLVDSSYHYGWIDVRLFTPVYSTDGLEMASVWPRLVRTGYENVADQPVRVLAIPEPSAILIALLATAVAMVSRRTKPTAQE